MTHDARISELLDQIATVVGAEKFNRIVASVSETRRRGRLRYWQIELFKRIAPEVGKQISSLDQFVELFGSAQTRRITITRDGFRNSPNLYYNNPHVEIEDEWICDAWETSLEFRENVSYEYVREASKNGDLLLLLPELKKLARILLVDRMVELYCRVRDTSPHREAEFRPTFAKVLGDRMKYLPPMLRKSEVIDALGLELAQALGVISDDAHSE